jgi:hypothetical protein
MSKQTGLFTFLLVDGYDISGDTQQLGTVAKPRELLDVTPINKGAFERLSGKRDGTLELVAFFNPAVGAAHEVLSALPTADTCLSFITGASPGAPAGSLVAKQITYDGTREDDGMLTFAVSANGNAYGLEWGHLLTGDGTVPYTTSGGAEDLDGFDDGAGAATDFGLQAYLHVLDFTGTSVTVTLEDSDDDGTDPYAAIPGGAFAAATGPGWQRIETGRTANVKEFVRPALTGTYTNAVIAVSIVRNVKDVTF